MTSHRYNLSLVMCFSFAVLPLAHAIAQDADAKTNEEATSLKIEISDEPKSVDPASVVPEKLAQKVTKEFTESTLRDILRWIESDLQIGVSLDSKALSKAGVLMSEPVADRLNDEPLYLLLDRLRVLELGWYFEDGRIQLTTAELADEHMQTVYYNIGDLRDDGYIAEDVMYVITECTGGEWMDTDGDGGELVLLGDVLFVRHKSHVQREVKGLLTAIRKHSRRTLTLDPPQHSTLRSKLDQLVTVEFRDLPLADAIDQLANQIDADIRLDLTALQKYRIRDRTPVTVSMTDQKVRHLFRALLAELNLTWMLRDGVLWITHDHVAGAFMGTAVFDVRDLCRNDQESMALEDAIQRQTSGEWDSSGADEGASMASARPGALVIRGTGEQLDEVLELLNNYRIALRGSKPRAAETDDPKEVITHYYVLPTTTATELSFMLSKLIAPESWQSNAQPKAPGTIRLLTSTPRVIAAGSLVTSAKGKQTGVVASGATVIPQTAMIIVQRRELHREIATLVNNIENGTSSSILSEDMGGGGFGGGYFSVKPNRAHAQ